MEALLDQVKSDVFAAVIAGSDGVVYYTTPGFVTNPKEFREISDIFGTESKDIYNGFKFQDKTFAVIELTPTFLAAETNSSVLYIQRSEEFMVLTFQNQKKLRDLCRSACSYVFDQIVKFQLFNE